MSPMSRALVSGAALVLAAGLSAGCDAQDQGGMTEEELRVMIDSLLPTIAEASGLEVRQPVQFALQSLEEARLFIERQLEEELGPGELEGMARSYKAFGVLPEALDLRSLLLDLYTEQVVGYYDPRTDRLYVLEGARPATAGPVVAHELVHALQDQLTDLDSLVARERGNDRQMAAQAAAEGQATLVMMALQAAETTGRPIDPGALPDIAELLRPALEAENAQFPVFQNAPALIRETLLFPYLGGAGFVQALYRSSGATPPVPFGDLLPQSTEQVLRPSDRFAGGPDAPTEIELERPAADWTVVYTNTLGQLELSIVLEEHLPGEHTADGWDGDRYALLEGPDGREALVWYSVWDDTDAADALAASYRRVLDAREGRVGRVQRLEVDGRPVVRVVEADAGLEVGAVPVPPIASLRELARR
jgi:hypothetical protein